MNPKQIERFFKTLARELGAPATVILTGAAAGSLWGHLRPSLDIDFAIRPTQARRTHWATIEEAVERTVRLTGIRANYAEDIERWSPISFLDYQRRTHLYRRFESLQVRLIDPAYWSIGKVSRYLDPDIRDLVAVLKRQRLSVNRLVRLWARAIRSSPRSPALTQCRRQVEHFLRAFGRTVWGTDFEPERAIARFHLELMRRKP